MEKLSHFTKFLGSGSDAGEWLRAKSLLSTARVFPAPQNTKSTFKLFSHSICLNFCKPMDCSTSGFPALHCLPEFAQTHVHWVNDGIQIFHHLSPSFSCPQSLSASESFPMSWFFASGDQSTGASASASVLPMNIQGWFPLGLMVWSPCCPRGS